MTLIRWLFDTSGFVLRSECGPGWTVGLRSAYVAANAVTSLSFLAIAAILLRLYVAKRKDMPRPCVVMNMVLLVLFSSVLSSTNVFVFWFVPYRFYAMLHAAAAIFAAGTVIYLPGGIEHIIALPSRADMHKVNEELQAKYLESELARAEVSALKADLETKNIKLQAHVESLKEQIEYIKKCYSYDSKTMEFRSREKEWYTDTYATLAGIEEIIKEG